jgi:hypothetical protein
LRHCFKSVCCRGAAAGQGGQESAKQAGTISHNPDSADFDDEPEQVKSQPVRDVEDHALYRRRHCALPPRPKNALHQRLLSRLGADSPRSGTLLRVGKSFFGVEPPLIYDRDEAGRHVALAARHFDQYCFRSAEMINTVLAR